MPTRAWKAVRLAALAALPLTACTEEARPPFLGGTLGLNQTAGNVFTARSGTAFTGVLIQGGTFLQGKVARTVTHRVRDMTRAPMLIDFNGDGRVDPVIGYSQQNSGIVQLLVSYGDAGTVSFGSLTLDGGDNQWKDLRDVAVADIDNDGALDILAATAEGVVYLHHPSNRQRTHVLSEWGAPTGALELIEGTSLTLSAAEIQSVIATALNGAVDTENYIPVVEQGYTSLDVGDFNNDGYNDVAASRHAKITLTPKANIDLPEILIVAGSIQVLLSPGATTTGEYWTGIAVGQHERHATFDRSGASALRAIDLDRDGDLDLVSAATDDNNVQLAWFENPGGPGGLDPTEPWRQHRIGSVRGPVALDIADLTGDGRVDVIVASPAQMQLVLFVQPEEAAARGYDWFASALATFESYEPRAVQALDLDNDGQLELVVGGTKGAVRYFARPPLPAAVTDPWTAHIVVTFNPPGDVGLLGYGDLDGDGDADLVAVVSDGESGPANRVTWIRNELIP